MKRTPMFRFALALEVLLFGLMQWRLFYSRQLNPSRATTSTSNREATCV